MIRIDRTLTPEALGPDVDRVFAASSPKIFALEKTWDPRRGAPVFTVEGKYTSRGWTDWTQGFVYGSAILQFSATDDAKALALGRAGTLSHLTPHLTHTGVHDHGFNIVSTYGHLYHLARKGRFPAEKDEIRLYELALKVSGAVQAARWTQLSEGKGFIYSFNGPHSLFVDTIRSLRSLAIAHQLGHMLVGESDLKVSLLDRLLRHAKTTSRFNVYFGRSRDSYDVRGRVSHESIFNTNDGSYRCPSTQQGYSPFTTWTRGMAWALCGYSEQIEYLDSLPDAELEPFGGKTAIVQEFLDTARAIADFYIQNTPTDGVPYWDTGAPGLVHLGDYLNNPADPLNGKEPVDSSAAAIAAQGLIRLGHYLRGKGNDKVGEDYVLAGLTVARTIFREPYLSMSSDHQGLLLHSVYHRPNGWDYIPPGRTTPCGEACMWGDYHLRELAFLVKRLAKAGSYYSFFEG